MRLLHKTSSRLALGVLAVATVAACNGSFAGSGTLPSRNRGIAYTSFKILCSTSTQQVTGSLVYIDPAAGVGLVSRVLSKATVTTQPAFITLPGPGPSSSPIPLASWLDTQGIPYVASTQPGYLDILAGCDNDQSRGRYAGKYGTGTQTGAFQYDVTANSACPSGYWVSISFQGGRYNGYDHGGCVTGKIQALNVP